MLKGLRVRLPDSLGHTALLGVTAAGVSITDFVMEGNAATVSQQERAPLLVIRADDFGVEGGAFYSSSKEGITVEADTGHITGGVIRDISGRSVMRDLVSINGGYAGKKVRNVLVENVRNYQSALDIYKCNGLMISDVKIAYGDYEGTAVRLKDSENTVVNGLILMDKNVAYTHVIHYLLSSGKNYSGIKITKVMAPPLEEAGIVLTLSEKGASLRDYIIDGNLTSVRDEIQSGNRTVKDKPGK